jgi:hypothetical protein
VILNGYHDQTADAPAGVPVEIHAGPEGWLGACGYAWPADNQGCDTSALIPAVEKVSARKVTSFHGCYRAPSWKLHADLSVTSDCAEDAGYSVTGFVDEGACEPDAPPANLCSNASGVGDYIGWYCDLGYPMITTGGISCGEALASCELNASANPDMSFYCTWNGELIHEAELSPGACDWLSDP